MSPTSRKRTKKKRPTIRRGPNPVEVFDELIAMFAEATDPIRAEVMTSEVLGMWWSAAPNGINVIGAAVVAHAEHVVADENALALLTGLSALATGELAASATAAARALTDAGVRPPAWADSIGRAEPGECWRWGDVFGDMVSVFCRFDGPMGPHAVCALIDRTAGNFAKDAWLVVDPEDALDEVRRTFAEQEDAHLLEVRRIDQSEARRLIKNGFRATDIMMAPPVGDTLPDFRALVLARCQLLPQPAEPEALSEAEQAQLVSEFLTETGLDPDGAARRCAERYVEYWGEMNVERPSRVSAVMAEVFLCDIPAEPLTPAEIEAMPATVIAFVRWSAARRGLTGRAVEFLMEQVERSAAGFADSEFDCIDLPSPREESYVVRVDLEGAKPPIWRRLRVPGNLSLGSLHRVLQNAFEWDGSHAHQFRAGALLIGGELDDLDYDLDEDDVSVSELAPDPGATLEYVYDFGDSWTHVIKVEKIEPQNTEHPIACLGGRRAAPVEDSGGVWGWAEKLKVAVDPSHPEHEEILEWFDGQVPDPEAFDVEAVDRVLHAMITRSRTFP